MEIKVVNDMGDTLGIFEDDQDAARFENAIRLLGEVPTRSNPSGEGGLAGHPLLRGISGIDEIILRVNIAVFGTESIRITERAAPLIHFFFANRSGELDGNFFYTLAAFTKAELRALIGSFRRVYTRQPMFENKEFALAFHDGTPFLQLMYVGKQFRPIDTFGTGLTLEVSSSAFEDKRRRSRERYLFREWLGDLYTYAAFEHFSSVYQVTPIQMAHINEASRICAPRAQTGESVRKDLDILFNDSLQDALSLRRMSDRVAVYEARTVSGMTVRIYQLAILLAASGEAFDVIQEKGLGFEKTFETIETNAIGGGRLDTRDIYGLYIARDPEVMWEFGVEGSYFRWALPLVVDMLRYQSRPSGSPEYVKGTLEVLDALIRVPDFVSRVCVEAESWKASGSLPSDLKHLCYGEHAEMEAYFGNDHMTPLGNFFDYEKLRDDLEGDDLARGIVLVYVGSIFSLGAPRRTSSALFRRASHLTRDRSDLSPIFEAVRDLKDRIPKAGPLRKVGDRVEVSALERYNPLNLFVGHSKVSSCCMYVGSAGYSCSKDAFVRSVASGDKAEVPYGEHTSHIIVGYDTETKNFVGSNWVWGPEYSRRMRCVDYKVESEYLRLPEDMRQMYILDQFELGVWALNIEGSDGDPLFPVLTDFVETVVELYPKNPFGYVLAGTEGYTDKSMKTAIHSAANRGVGLSSQQAQIVHYTNDPESIYSDISYDPMASDYPTRALYLPGENSHTSRVYGKPNSDDYPACDSCNAVLSEGDECHSVETVVLCDDCVQHCSHCDTFDAEDNFFLHDGDLLHEKCYTECDECRSAYLIGEGCENDECPSNYPECEECGESEYYCKCERCESCNELLSACECEGGEDED